MEKKNKFLTAFSDFGGAPKNWKMIENEQERVQLAIINPKYKLDPEYRSNCVNCIMAYELRKRGYDVTAKSRKEYNVCTKADGMWNDVEKHSADTLADVISSIDATVDARYFLGYTYSPNIAHAVVISVENGVFTIFDPQRSCIMTQVELTTEMTFVYWRIDNLEVIQTGYNACKGRDSV